MTYKKRTIVSELNMLLVLITLSHRHQFEQPDDIATICYSMKNLAEHPEEPKESSSQIVLIEAMKRKYSLT